MHSALLVVRDHLMSFYSGQYRGTSLGSRKALRFLFHLTNFMFTLLEDRFS